MEWLALFGLAIGGYFLDSAIVDRAPLKFIQDVIKDPSNFSDKWAASRGTGGRDISLTYDSVSGSADNESSPSGTATSTTGSKASDGVATVPRGAEGKNGKLPKSMLAEIPWAKGKYVYVNALPSLVNLNKEYKAKFGKNLVITSAYRTLAAQYTLKENPATGYLAANPGTSNHGYGTAIDFGGGINTFGTAEHNWMVANAPQFNWVHPSWAEPKPVGTLPEAWHFEWTGQDKSTTFSGPNDQGYKF